MVIVVVVWFKFVDQHTISRNATQIENEKNVEEGEICTKLDSLKSAEAIETVALVVN